MSRAARRRAPGHGASRLRPTPLFLTSFLLLAVVALLLALPPTAQDVQAQSTTPTANADDSYTVPIGWELTPSGLGPGDRFRLLFRTPRTDYAGMASGIATYNNIVQGVASGGHEAIAPYGSAFRAVVSIQSTSARVNTGMYDTTNSVWADGSTSSNKGSGTPIYWLNGARVANSYADFCDNSWASIAFRQPDGTGAGDLGIFMTGSNDNCTSHSSGYLGPGAGLLAYGESNSGLLSAVGRVTGSYLGMSPEFVVAEKVEVPHDWSLIPDGLGVGDQFRLIFLTSTRRNAVPTNIADYNTFVQTAAAGGHADIQAHRGAFRVVGSTATVAARVNTGMWDGTALTDGSSMSDQTPSTAIPIYWLNGSKVADSYYDFYDRTWDDEANPRTQAGATTSVPTDGPFTGSFDDGRSQGSGWPLGNTANDNVEIARLNSSGASHTPLSSGTSQGKTMTRQFYGLSFVFEVAAPKVNDDGSYTVPVTWPLKPAGVGVGEKFRLLFVNSGGDGRNATSTDIAVYNAHIQGVVADANEAHAAIVAYAPYFKVVGSTAAMDARVNTGMWSTGENATWIDGSTDTAKDTGIPVYWLNGKRVANSYADFYDGTWTNIMPGDITDEGGANRTWSGSNRRVWTGTKTGGQAHDINPFGHPTQVARGDVTTAPRAFVIDTGAPSNTLPFYGMSPEFLVDPEGQPTVTVSAATTSITEGTTVDFTVTIDTPPAADLTVNLEVTDDDTSDFLDASQEGAQTVTITAGATMATYRVVVPQDNRDEPDGEITVTVVAGNGYTPANAAPVMVADDDDAPSIALSVSPAIWFEDRGSTQITVTARVQGGTTFGLAQALSGTVSASGGTNVVGFNTGSFAINIPAGAASAATGYTLTPQNDSTIENNETVTFSATISPATGITITGATLRLLDDDGSPTSPLQGLRVTRVEEDRIDVAWDALSGAAQYKVELRHAQGVETKETQTVTGVTASFTTGLAGFTPYTIAVWPMDQTNNVYNGTTQNGELRASYGDAVQVRTISNSIPMNNGVPVYSQDMKLTSIAYTSPDSKLGSGNVTATLEILPSADSRDREVSFRGAAHRFTVAGSSSDALSKVGCGPGGDPQGAILWNYGTPNVYRVVCEHLFTKTLAAGSTGMQLTLMKGASYRINVYRAPLIAAEIKDPETNPDPDPDGRTDQEKRWLRASIHPPCSSCGPQYELGLPKLDNVTGNANGVTGRLRWSLSPGTDGYRILVNYLKNRPGNQHHYAPEEYFVTDPMTPWYDGFTLKGENGQTLGVQVEVMPVFQSGKERPTFRGKTIFVICHSGGTYTDCTSTEGMARLAPEPPTEQVTGVITAPDGNGGVELRWNGVENAHGYVVDYYYVDAQPKLQQHKVYVSDPEQTSLDLTPLLTDGLEYNFRVMPRHGDTDLESLASVYVKHTAGSGSFAIPEVSVSASATDVAEGDDVVFTVGIGKAHTADLVVLLDVTETQGSGADAIAVAGLRTLTIPAGQTEATHTHTVTDDQVDRGGGTVTATVIAGDGYAVSATGGSVTVTLTDNDGSDGVVVGQSEDASGKIVVSVGSVTKTGAEATWDAVDGAERYMVRWWVSGDRDGTLQYEPVLTNSKTLEGLTAGTTYEVEVVARVNGVWQKENTSDPVSFTTASQKQQQPPPKKQQTPPPTPQVTISGGSDVTEGSDAVFTLTASPKPTADVTVSVDVSATGDYGVSTGSQTVTIGTGGTATLTVGTTDDSADEPHGSVTATIQTGTGYDVGTASSATITLSDNDVPEVTISGGSDVTEGGDAVFTLTASPKPAADITVSVDVSATGEFGASTGTQTVTIGTGGTATLTVGTTNDDVDGTDGSVTATIQTGMGYDVGTANAATIAVEDDDDPPPADRIVVSVGSVTADGAEVSWEAVDGAERYMVRWWVSGDRDGTLQYEAVTTNSKTLDGLSAETTYEVEVVARVNGEWEKENTSDPVSFTTLAP